MKITLFSAAVQKRIGVTTFMAWAFPAILDTLPSLLFDS